MTAAIENDIVREFRAFENENGPSYIWGQISAPYDGCFYLNACVIVKGDYAYITTDISRLSRYRQYNVDTPDGVTSQACEAGCIRLEDVEKVLSRSCTELEFHPLSDLADNTPRALVGVALEICRTLDYAGLVEGKFTCHLCETDLLYAEGIDYLEGEFRGNGGIGIEVGDPVCSECYSLHHCPYCGTEVEPEFQDIDDPGHCIYCAPDIECSCCGEDIELGWGASEADIQGYPEGFCGDCHEQKKRGEEENAKYTTIADATGILFP